MNLRSHEAILADLKANALITPCMWPASHLLPQRNQEASQRRNCNANSLLACPGVLRAWTLL